MYKFQFFFNIYLHFQKEIEQIIEVKEMFTLLLFKMPVQDVSSIKVISSALSIITEDYENINENIVVSFYFNLRFKRNSNKFEKINSTLN